MRRLIFSVVVLSCALAFSHCRDIQKNDYTQLSGRIFIFNYRLASATYMVTLEKLRPVPDGSMAVARFENPAGGSDLEVQQKIWPLLTRISLESPPLTCVVKDRPYKFKVQIRDANGALLQEIDSSVTSTLDQTILPDRPLVVGQGYSANPELKGHPDGKLPNVARAVCPG